MSKNFKTLEREIQFTRVCENATFFHRVSVRMCYKTVADVDDGFGEMELQHEERKHTLVRTRIPEFEQTIIGPVLQVHVVKPPGNCGIEI